MRKILIILFLGSLFTVSNGQTTFQRVYGGSMNERGYSVQTTIDGGFVIVGNTESYGAGSSDVYLIKLNGIGDTLWTRTYGGIDEDEGRFVRETSDSGFVISGLTYSFGSGSSDVYLIKTDLYGNLLWSKTYGGINYDGAQSIVQTNDGGFAIIGVTSSFGGNGSAVYLLKTDANGDLLWTKTYDGPSFQTGCSIKQTVDGGFILLGTTESLISGPFSGNDLFLIKTDSFGNLIWSKTYGGNDNDLGLFVQQTTDGGYILAGNTSSFSGIFALSDIYLIKTDAIGDTLWTKTYGGPSTDVASAVCQTPDGGYAICGYTLNFGDYGAIIIKTNSIGDTLWTKTYRGFTDNFFHDLKQTQDGGYILLGEAGDLGSSTLVYLVKTDSNGISGCHESNESIIINTPATQVYSPSLIVSFGGNSLNAPALVSNGGEATILCLTSGVGLTELNIDNLNVFPNPISGGQKLTIKGNELNNDKSTIQFFEVSGRKIHESQLRQIGKDCEMEMPYLTAGMYICQIESGKRLGRLKLLIY